MRLASIDQIKDQSAQRIASTPLANTSSIATMSDTRRVLGDRPSSPIMISPSPQPPTPSPPETPPPGSTRIYYGRAIGNPQQGYRFVRPATIITTTTSSRPSVSPLSSPPPPPPPITPLRTAAGPVVENAGAAGATAPEVGQAASTLMQLFSDDCSQAWLRAKLSLGLGTDAVPTETRVEPLFSSASVLNQDATSREAEPANISSTLDLAGRPQRPRKQNPYNFAPILDKISRNDPEYIDHPVRRVVHPSTGEKNSQREAEVTRRVAATIDQHSAKSDELKSGSNDPQSVRAMKRKADSSISKPPAKRQRPALAKSITPLPPTSKRTTRASVAKAVEENVRASSESDQDRSRSRDSVLLGPRTTTAPIVEDGENITDSASPEDPEDEDMRIPGRRNTNTGRARVSRTKYGDENKHHGRTRRTSANMSTTRQPSTQSAKASRRAKKPKTKDPKRDYQRFDVRDGKGRFVRKSEP